MISSAAASRPANKALRSLIREWWKYEVEIHSAHRDPSFSTSVVPAQKTEITISFSEQFFDALLDAVFLYAEPPEFPLAANTRRDAEPVSRPSITSGMYSFAETSVAANEPCTESVKLLRENAGTRTSVRFREGKITAPLAFTGKYNPPLIGCVAFTGTADTLINLEFDQAGQRLIARVKVRDVSLNGTGGIGRRVRSEDGPGRYRSEDQPDRDHSYGQGDVRPAASELGTGTDEGDRIYS
jgi:hypothetical protein